MSESLDIYTVYDHPSDYPNHYVVRRTRIVRGEQLVDPEPALVASALDDVHREMERLGKYFLMRMPGDDPVILGIFI